jgi:putative SOS response-associated peptidase YedK
MCGRFALYSSAEAIARYAKALQKISDWEPNYNVAPGSMIPVITQAEEKVLVTKRWGLVPFWAKDDKFAAKLINARCESVAEKPSFRAAFQQRRCLLVANGYYEWDKNAKQPYYFFLPDSELFFLAGIWESWQAPDGKNLQTCSIITKAASDNIAHLHHRMPVILSPETAEKWLQSQRNQDLIGLLYNESVPNPNYHPVSIAVNSTRNNYPDLIESIAT